MRTIRYGQDDLLVSDATAEALLALASLEAESTTAATISIRALDASGRERDVSLVVGPATMMSSSPASSPYPEPDNSEFERLVRQRTQLHDSPPTVPTEVASPTETALDEV